MDRIYSYRLGRSRRSAAAPGARLRNDNVSLMGPVFARALPAAICRGAAEVHTGIDAGFVDVVVLRKAAHGASVYMIYEICGIKRKSEGYLVDKYCNDFV